MVCSDDTIGCLKAVGLGVPNAIPYPYTDIEEVGRGSNVWPMAFRWIINVSPVTNARNITAPIVLPIDVSSAENTTAVDAHLAVTFVTSAVDVRVEL